MHKILFLLMVQVMASPLQALNITRGLLQNPAPGATIAQSLRLWPNASQWVHLTSYQAPQKESRHTEHIRFFLGGFVGACAAYTLWLHKQDIRKIYDDRHEIIRTWSGVDEQLHAAVGNGSYEEVCRALDAKADINARDKYGRTPLNRAVGLYKTALQSKDTGKIIKLLIEKGADVTVRDYPAYTLLHAILSSGTWRWSYKQDPALRINNDPEFTQIVALLLASGKFDIDERSIDGQTPLSLAINYHCPVEVIAMLLKLNPNLAPKDYSFGRTAEEYLQKEIVDLEKHRKQGNFMFYTEEGKALPVTVDEFEYEMARLFAIEKLLEAYKKEHNA